MNNIRSLSVDEWFLSLQLKNIKQGFHIPFYVEADISSLHKKFEGKKIHHTALLVKAASCLIQEMPEINKVTFNTIMGQKVFFPDYNGVNIPILNEIDGKTVLTGITIYDAYKKSFEEIMQEIRVARERKFDDLPVNRIIHGSDLRLIKKLKLRTIYFLLKNFPSIYSRKRGGGVSVSSLLNLASPNLNVHMNAFGMTTLTISSCTLLEQGEKKLVKVGVGFDHLTTHGYAGTKAVLKLTTILQNAENF